MADKRGRELEEEELDEEELDDEDLEDEDDDDDGGDGRSHRRSRSSGSGSRGGRFSGRRSFGRRPRFCSFCGEKTRVIDYKQVDLLRRYVTDQGKIRGRRQTGTCARHQRMLSQAIKRSRQMALLPYAGEIRR